MKLLPTSLFLLCLIVISSASFANELTVGSIVHNDSTVMADSIHSAVPAQSTPGKRPYIGANVSFRFWNDLFSVGLYPLIGFPITNEFSAGLKAGFAVTNDSRVEPTLKTNHYGGGGFVRYKLIPELYVHGEFASYSLERASNYTYYGYTVERNWVPFLFLGAGYAQKIGGDNTFTLEVLFDAIQDDKSPFEGGDPFISLGFVAGF